MCGLSAWVLLLSGTAEKRYLHQPEVEVSAIAPAGARKPQRAVFLCVFGRYFATNRLIPPHSTHIAPRDNLHVRLRLFCGVFAPKIAKLLLVMSTPVMQEKMRSIPVFPLLRFFLFDPLDSLFCLSNMKISLSTVH